jgi:hypothetical protein
VVRLGGFKAGEIEPESELVRLDEAACDEQRFTRGELTLGEELANQAVVAVPTRRAETRLVIATCILGRSTIASLSMPTMMTNVSVWEAQVRQRRRLAARVRRAMAIQQVQALPQQGHQAKHQQG